MRGGGCEHTHSDQCRQVSLALIETQRVKWDRSRGGGESERWGRHRVYSGATWSAAVIPGPGPSVCVVRRLDGWCEPGQRTGSGSHKVLCYTGLQRLAASLSEGKMQTRTNCSQILLRSLAHCNRLCRNFLKDHELNRSCFCFSGRQTTI